jgi:hypothetical protein
MSSPVGDCSIRLFGGSEIRRISGPVHPHLVRRARVPSNVKLRGTAVFCRVPLQRLVRQLFCLKLIFSAVLASAFKWIVLILRVEEECNTGIAAPVMFDTIRGDRDVTFTVLKNGPI